MRITFGIFINRYLPYNEFNFIASGSINKKGIPLDKNCHVYINYLYVKGPIAQLVRALDS